jgi:hypothetical protein
MTKEKDKPDNSKSATNEPWKHPGQACQQPGKKPPPKADERRQ